MPDNPARAPSEQICGGFLGVKVPEGATPVIKSAAQSAHLVEDYTVVLVPLGNWNDFTLAGFKR